MGMCYWCHWGWPKPIRDIYDEALEKLNGCESPLHFGAHNVWEDENWDSAKWCLDHFDDDKDYLTDYEKEIVRESLVKLLAVPDEYKCWPEGYDDDDMHPEKYPPPEYWKCERR